MKWFDGNRPNNCILADHGPDATSFGHEDWGVGATRRAGAGSSQPDGLSAALRRGLLTPGAPRSRRTTPLLPLPGEPEKPPRPGVWHNPCNKKATWLLVE